MIQSNFMIGRLFAVVLALSLAALLTGCGESPPATAPAGDEGAPAQSKPTSDEADTAPAASSVGRVAFSVGGEDRSFEYLPEAECFYTALASAIRAYPAAGSTESLAIQFSSMDLKKFDYPVDLPLPKDFSKPMDPLAAGALIGISYVNADGVEWAGPAKARVESFATDGTITGTFGAVTLPHTADELPEISLTGGTFVARITGPW